jgi:hypothetical protein
MEIHYGFCPISQTAMALQVAGPMALETVGAPQMSPMYLANMAYNAWPYAKKGAKLIKSAYSYAAKRRGKRRRGSAHYHSVGGGHSSYGAQRKRPTLTKMIAKKGSDPKRRMGYLGNYSKWSNAKKRAFAKSSYLKFRKRKRKRRARTYRRKGKRRRMSVARQLEKYLSMSMVSRNYDPRTRIATNIFPKEFKRKLRTRDTIQITATALGTAADYRLLTLTPNDINTPFGAHSNYQGDGLDEIKHLYDRGVCTKFRVAIRMRNNQTEATEDIKMFIYTNNEDETAFTTVVGNTDHLKAMKLPNAKMHRSTNEVIGAPSKWVQLYCNPRLTDPAKSGTNVASNKDVHAQLVQSISSVAGLDPPNHKVYLHAEFFRDENESPSVKVTSTTTWLVDVVIEQWCIFFRNHLGPDDDAGA